MKIHIKNGRLIDPASNIDKPLRPVHRRRPHRRRSARAGRLRSQQRAGRERAASSAPGWSTSRRACASRASNTAPRSNPKWRGDGRRRHQLACPPDTDPVLDEPGLVEMLTHRAKPARVRPRLSGRRADHATGRQALTEMAELSEAGCVAFGQANHAIVDTQVLLRAMHVRGDLRFPVWLQAQDPFLAVGVAHDGEVAARLGLAGIPVAAETIALATICNWRARPAPGCT
jgi:dihydroorotase